MPKFAVTEYNGWLNTETRTIVEADDAISAAISRPSWNLFSGSYTGRNTPAGQTAHIQDGDGRCGVEAVPIK